LHLLFSLFFVVFADPNEGSAKVIEAKRLQSPAPKWVVKSIVRERTDFCHERAVANREAGQASAVFLSPEGVPKLICFCRTKASVDHRSAKIVQFFTKDGFGSDVPVSSGLL